MKFLMSNVNGKDTLVLILHLKPGEKLNLLR